jgi:signal transduction histidine kinase/ActR/RegA family two-component response regulator
VSAVGKGSEPHIKDAAALLGPNILFQILIDGGYTRSNYPAACLSAQMIDRNYLFYLWVLRKLPIKLRSSPNFYFLLNSVFAVAFLLPIAGLMVFLSNPIATWTCIWAALVLSLNLLCWRLGLKMIWAHAVYQLTLIALILFNAACGDGLTSIYVMFMGLVPMLAVFCMSRWWAFFWVGFSFFCLMALFFAQVYGYLPMNDDQDWRYLAQSLMCIMVLEITQVILVFVYDSANAQNLHALNRINIRLAKTSDALKIADSHKDKFLAMVSHDMRTPLNAVIGYLGLLHDNKQLPGESMAFVSSAQHAAAHLLTVINDLLDFSQIRLGQLTLHPQVVNLHHVLNQTFHTLSHQAQEMQLEYRLTLADQLSTWVNLDQNRLSQMLINLLGNAIKFTPSGFVHMRVTEKQDAQGVRWLVVEVQDSGIGMTPEQQQRIYQPFTQVHDAQAALRLSEPMRGNGLGLAITMSLVKSHQGELSLHSVPGQGSTFTLRLPLELANEPQQPKTTFNAALNQDHSPLQLLVVDDNEVNRLLVTTTLLRSFPYAHIEQAENGQQALDKMHATLYDLVLIDLVMPDIDGAQVVQLIRQEAAKPLCDVPVVALTANVAQDAIERCRQAGINQVLSKPFDRNMLVRVVRFFTIDKQQGEL